MIAWPSADPAAYRRRVERLEQRRAATAPDLADPVALFRLATGGEPARWQRDVLTTDARRVVLLCARQSGKSSTAAARALATALVAPSLTLVVSPSLRQSQLLYKTVARLYAASGRPIPSDVENRLSLALANGSEVHALPSGEKTTRGYSGVGLLIFDEAAKVADETYYALLPTVVASGGTVLMMSTPAGRRGVFHATWEHGGPEWHRTKVTAREAAHLDPAELEAQRRAMPDFWWRQEFLCEFVDDETQLYPSDLVDAALSPAVAPLGLPRFGAATLALGA